MTEIVSRLTRQEKDFYVETNYRIVHQDEGFWVVEKPAPLPVHRTGRFVEKNLLSLLGRDFPLHAGDFRPVNRLDSETSGLVLIALDQNTAARLAIQFEERRVLKEYIGITAGKPSVQRGKIELPLKTVVNEHRYHFRTTHPEGEAACTEYEVLSESKNYALLLIRPKTGRMHQIRAHFAALGVPLLGDKLYTDLELFHHYVESGWSEDMLEKVKCPRLALHAIRLSFSHPCSGKTVDFSSPLPDFFEVLLAQDR